MASDSMKLIETIRDKLDSVQQRNRFLGFSYAVIWKYGDDKTGYLAALLTYYGFLALFPLLLVAVTVTTALSKHYPHLQVTIAQSIKSYFPVIGDQFSGHINALHETGIALLVGVLFTLYGARGVASAYRYGVNRIWNIPKTEELPFPKSTVNNVAIILIAGAGFIVAAAVAAAIVAFDHSQLFKLLSILAYVLMLFGLFIVLLKLVLPRHITVKHVWVGAALAAVGLVILQTIGGLLLARQLKNLDALYSYFALSLGLLFWIYLQAQVVYYSIQVSSVYSKKLWPRTLEGKLVHKT
jgi:YihY family inner membrane protein